MAARGALLRSFRRPLCQMTRSVATSSSSASATTRSHFAQVLEHDVALPPVPSFSSSDDLTLLGYPPVFRPRLFSSHAAGSSSNVILVNDDAHFQQSLKEVESSKSLGVVYFTAQWCGPCKQIAPYIDELSREFDDVTFLKIDVDNLKLEETMKDSRIGVVPTFQFHKGGKLVGELTGAVKDKLKNLVFTLRAKPQ
ncbi:hypothetical protein Mapa_010759 [Marchantia paleacea]|nr:hypothetical protein Mapa_010759 [Marchantia paleacea]